MPENTRALGLRFFIVYVLVAIMAMGISYVLIRYTGLPSGSVFSFLPVFVASIDAGHQFYRRSGRRPTSGENWSMAVVFTVIAFVVSLAIGLAVLGRNLLGAFDNPMVGVMLAVLTLLTFLSSWFFFRLGAKIQNKAAAKQ